MGARDANRDLANRCRQRRRRRDQKTTKSTVPATENTGKLSRSWTWVKLHKNSDVGHVFKKKADELGLVSGDQRLGQSPLAFLQLPGSFC